MKSVFGRILMIAFVIMMGLYTCAVACTEFCGQEDINVDSDKLPDYDTLHIEAYLLGDAAIGRTVHVLRSGYVRSAPNQSAQILTDVYPDDKVAILDYYMESANPLAMWLKIDFYGLEGWINASRGKIVSCPPDSYRPGNDPELEAMRSRYIGQTMMVKVGSGNARSGPGQDYPTIELVQRYQTYRIQDADYDSHGTLWFMIRIGSRSCWVHYNLMEYMGD